MKNIIIEFIKNLTRFYLELKLGILEKGINNSRISILDILSEMTLFFKENHDEISDFYLSNDELKNDELKKEEGDLLKEVYKIEKLIRDYYPLEFQKVSFSFAAIKPDDGLRVNLESFSIFLKNILQSLSYSSNFDYLNKIYIQIQNGEVIIIEN